MTQSKYTRLDLYKEGVELSFEEIDYLYTSATEDMTNMLLKYIRRAESEKGLSDREAKEVVAQGNLFINDLTMMKDYVLEVLAESQAAVVKIKLLTEKGDETSCDKN